HDRVVGGKDLGEPLDQWQRLLLIAGVDMHLATAGLLGREFDGLTQPLQHPYRRLSDLREQGVGEAGDEQCSSHRHPIESASTNLLGAVDTPPAERFWRLTLADRKAPPPRGRPRVPGSAHYRRLSPPPDQPAP